MVLGISITSEIANDVKLFDLRVLNWSNVDKALQDVGWYNIEKAHECFRAW